MTDNNFLSDIITMSDVIGTIAETAFVAVLLFLRSRIYIYILNRKGREIEMQEETLKDYSGILPIDHSGLAYIYDFDNKNIDVVDKGLSFIIPKDDKAEWFVFSKTVCSEGMKTLIETLKPILSEKRIKDKIIPGYSEDNLEAMISEARKEATTYINSQQEQSLFGICRIILNRKGEEENPWCNFVVYKTDLYTRNVMHILFNKLFPNGHNEAFTSIEDVHLLYPFIFELKLSISLISQRSRRDVPRIILKKEPYEYFEQKDVSDRWLLYASESIGQEDLDEDNTIDLEEAVKRRMRSYDVVVDNDRIDFHDIFFVTEQLSVSVLTSAVVPHHSCKGSEKSVSLTVNGIFDFLKKYGDSTADYCKYSLVMWLSRHCMEKA